VLVVTRKAASTDDAGRVVAQLRALAPHVQTAVAHLALDSLHPAVGGDGASLSTLTGRRVLAISAVGDPQAFFRQLETLGAVPRLAVYPDHYAYDAADAARLAASLAPDEMPVCTLKDAVKLAALWPRAAAPLWYVSQRVVVEEGLEAIDAAIDALLRARSRQP
jgi:tetraacyldisaccharide 4'-kinase